jgi:hypothetical protein
VAKYDRPLESGACADRLFDSVVATSVADAVHAARTVRPAIHGFVALESIDAFTSPVDPAGWRFPLTLICFIFYGLSAACGLRSVAVRHPFVHMVDVRDLTTPHISLDRPPKSGRSCETHSMDTVGWREWVALPEWGIEAVKAKIDTGARTSAIHADDIELFEREGVSWVRFLVRPWQRSDADAALVEAPRIDHRTVTSSSGTRTDRPVVLAPIVLCGRAINAEITLTSRDEMGFRMLIGREALIQGFTVDSTASYLGGRPKKDVRQKNRGHT